MSTLNVALVSTLLTVAYMVDGPEITFPVVVELYAVQAIRVLSVQGFFSSQVWKLGQVEGRSSIDV